MSTVVQPRSRAEVHARPRGDALYRSVIGVALATFRVMDWKVVIDGAQHIPLDGPAIIARIKELEARSPAIAGHIEG
jgi:hypothetical protein